MNMHGILSVKQGGKDSDRVSAVDKARERVARHRYFLAFVLAPMLTLALYLFLIASSQYVSEAHFLVRTAKSAEFVPATGISQAIGMVTGQGNSQAEAVSVADYLMSHDVVDTLRREDNLVERFHNRPADFFSRLRIKDPSPEYLLKYYRQQIKIHYDSETGITELAVSSFTPRDSYELARKLLELGERRVNLLNQRSYQDAIGIAQRQVDESQRKLELAQAQITQFRQSRGDIDPEASGKSQIGLVSTLTGQLSTARAQLNAMGGMIGTDSPQYLAVKGRVAALEAQVNSQSGKLTGGQTAIAGRISGYETLVLRQQFLSKQYEAAAANLEKSREDARKQQLYVTRVVDANLPVKPLYPERLRILLTAGIALLLMYSIGWLIAAGVREHAA